MFRLSATTRCCAGVVILFLSSNASEAQLSSICARKTVGTYPLVPELNHVSRCVRPLGCPGQLIQVETKRIGRDGGQIDLWLVNSNNVTATYARTQQDAIIQTAKGLANNYKPASKYVVDIVFDWTVITNLEGPNYFVGANITYAKCLAMQP
jgi:hypothetical protein